MENRVIFGWYRAGTKLLADLHTQANYTNFGEFFNVFSCGMATNNGLPYAERLPLSIQFSERKHRRSLSEEEVYQIKSKEISDRISVFEKHRNVTPSIVTVWWADTYFNPSVLNMIDDRYYLCSVRQNKIEQLLSGLLTIYNCNYNGEVESKSITVELPHVDYFYNQFSQTEKMQKKIVDSKKGRYIDFDKLIQGTEDIGFDYTVTTTDQHENLYKYFLNLDDIMNRLRFLMT